MKKKIILTLLYVSIKPFNNAIYIINKYWFLLLLLSISLSFLNNSLSLYISFLIIFIKLIMKLSNPINEVLSIDMINRTINMSTGINTQKMNRMTSIEKLNYLVNQFINGLETAALNPKKYNIKENKIYKFRTHGSLYVLFEKKLRRARNQIIKYDKVSVDNAINATAQKKLGLKTITIKDKLIYTMERIIIQTSLKEMLIFFEKIDLKKIQICEFEAIFIKNQIFIKAINKKGDI